VSDLAVWHRAAVNGDDWDQFTIQQMSLLAEAVADVAGFEIAAIGIVQPAGELRVAIVAGSDEARASLLGSAMPEDALAAEFARAEDWGMFKHTRIDDGVDLPEGMWVPDLPPAVEPDDWDPMDLLMAPLLDRDGVMRATLSVDIPRTGKLPNERQLRLLNRYAEQATQLMQVALDRQLYAEQLRLAAAAREAIRTVSADSSIPQLLAEVGPTLVDVFGLSGLWVWVFGKGSTVNEEVHTFADATAPLDQDLLRQARMATEQMWESSTGAVVSHAGVMGVALDTTALSRGYEIALEYLDSHYYESIALMPLGVGREALGLLAMVRITTETWTHAQIEGGVEVGRDLSRVLLNAQAFKREQESVRQLTELDRYKNRLIATVSHELKNPLSAILGNLEMLEGTANDAFSERALTSLERATQRMSRLVDDLLLFARAGDAEVALDARPVDLLPIVREVSDLIADAAQQRDLHIAVRQPAQPAIALGDPAELDRVLVNLISNAVKYSPSGGRITVSLARFEDEIELRVADQGIGISEEDQERLFTEFFRSSNPEATLRPGTGLGLAIVDRIVRRHGGSIDVESELGRGSTFRVRLPAAAADPAE
jgi:signal transduction histidine kinase